MPRSSRAYALSVLALAGGLGAGVAVVALRLADIGANGWRLIYLLSLVWLLPVIVLAIGFVIVVSKAKKLESAPAPAAEAKPALANDADEDPYLARVREMVEKS